MWRACGVVAGIALFGCGRLGFSAGSDGGAPDGERATHDAASMPLVQTVTTSTSTGGLAVNAANGLEPVTAGDMVLVMCGAEDATGPCAPTSVPSATWTEIDPGSHLSAYVTCGAPAITSIELTNGSGPAAAIVAEWSGMATTACYDAGNYGVVCGTSSWTVNVPYDTKQNKELLVALGMANNATTWAVDAPYTLAATKVGPSNSVAVFVGAELADPSPAMPSVTGTVGSWSGFCYDDLFAFEAVQ